MSKTASDSKLQKTPDRDGNASFVKKHNVFRRQITKLGKSSKLLIKRMKNSYDVMKSDGILDDCHLDESDSNTLRQGTGSASSERHDSELIGRLDVELFESHIMAMFVPLPESDSEPDPPPRNASTCGRLEFQSKTGGADKTELGDTSRQCSWI